MVNEKEVAILANGIPEQTAGQPVEFQALGKTWKLQRKGPAIRRKFSDWLKQRAWDALEESRRFNPRGYDRREQSLLARMASGAYDWGVADDEDSVGEAVQEALNEPVGKGKILRLMLEKHHGAITAEVLNAIAEANPLGLGRAYLMALGLSPNVEAGAGCSSAPDNKPASDGGAAV